MKEVKCMEDLVACGKSDRNGTERKSYDCSSKGFKNHDKTERMACLGIIKSRSTLLSGGKCVFSGSVTGGWYVFLPVRMGIGFR